MAGYSYLYDEAFLKIIDELPARTRHVKLKVFTYDDYFLGSIEGLATGGSFSLNGKSNIRRTGNITLIASDEVYNITNVENIISLNKKVEVEVGIENDTILYPTERIIWFPLGTYVITGASITHNTSNLQVQVNLKDEMARLNGECGGTIPIELEHSPINVIGADGKPVLTPVRFYDAIMQVVTQWGGIPEHKVIIENVPLRNKQVVRWTGSGQAYSYFLGTDAESFVFSTVKPSSINDAIEYNFKDNIGYRYVDFVIPVEKTLSSKPGDSVASVLDQIAKMLGNFEYFFDIYGNFRFREIKNQMNEGSPIDELGKAINSKYLLSFESENSVYGFLDGKISTSYQNAPKYANIKNDITVIGKRDNAEIKYHLLIDYKPAIKEGVTYYVLFEEDSLNKGTKYIKQGDMTAHGAPWQPITLDGSDVWQTQILLDYKCKGIWHPLAQELELHWHKIYDIENKKYYPLIKNGADKGSVAVNNMINIKYYIDMLDPREVPAIEPYSITKIGRRERVYKADDVNCIFSPVFPNYIFLKAGSDNIEADRKEAIDNGDKWTQVSKNTNSGIEVGLNTNPAYDYLRSVLHEMLGYGETISISAVPIYHLDVNSRISVKDDRSCINGDYMINSMQLPLAPGGQMTIQAQRVQERI